MPRDRERGKSGVFPTIDPSIPNSWSETKGNKRVCLHLLAGGRAEVGFLLLLCCHGACGDVNGGLFSRGIHCAICAFLVSNVFSAAKWGVAQDRNTWMCESIVSLARNNTHTQFQRV
ncbi:hypothetical protein TcCL_NonESM02612 [Trypanosoma cruzi]|nr:hypothetical protein TcCL_NonESM02612 [Trypanosoma cruzi]